MEAISAISVAGLNARPSRIADEITVGKDILELLTGAMYADPLTVYREYVQNSADALDDAKDAGLDVDHAPQVSIWLNHEQRSVRIRDIGIGVSNRDFVRRLTSIGASTKRGKSRRGFRGVGRLSGLGYCQEVVFRSRSSKLERVKELRWDGRILRERLRDASFEGSLADIVREVTTTSTLNDATQYPDHFFEVEMIKVLRIRNDVLMNEEEVRNYLSQVAPVPFSPAFALGSTIADWLSKHGLYNPLHIELNDDKGPVYHRAVDEIALPRHPPTAFNGVNFLEVTDSGGELLAAGWTLEHDYAGAISRTSKVGGIRLRCRGVQVGSEDVLAQYFVEPRFATWAAGDLHVIHPRIVPNGRRDEFEISPAYSELQDALRGMARQLTHTIRTRSESRRIERNARVAIRQVEEWTEVAENKKLHETTRRVATQRALSLLENSIRYLRRLPEGSSQSKAAKQFESKLGKLQVSLALPIKPGRRSAAKTRGAHAAVEAILASTHLTKRSVPIAEQVLAALEGRS